MTERTHLRGLVSVASALAFRLTAWRRIEATRPAKIRADPAVNAAASAAQPFGDAAHAATLAEPSSRSIHSNRSRLIAALTLSCR